MKKETIYVGAVLLGLILVSWAFAQSPTDTASATFAVQ